MSKAAVWRVAGAVALLLVALVAVSMGTIALVIGGEPLFALAYGLSYGLLAFVALIALGLTLLIVALPVQLGVRAIRRRRRRGR